jgi:adenylate cyclase class 2
MNTECEIRILDIDIDDITNKLEELGAEKIGEYNQKRYVYDIIPAQEGKFIRLRTNGYETTLAYKDKAYTSMSSTKELEMKIEDFSKAHMFLKTVGFLENKYIENKRITYVYNDVEFDIDCYPMIPPYMEIEASNESIVNEFIDRLGLRDHVLTVESLKKIYCRYNIDFENIKKIEF